MSQRHEFIQLYLHGRHVVAELCSAFGVSEKTGYKWLRRFAADGVAGLADRPHIPRTTPHQVAAEVVQRITGFRGKHPTWGPRKLRKRLQSVEPTIAWPAASTFGAILKRHGLVRARRRVRGPRWAPLDLPLTEPAAPNDVWTADFKGEFPLRQGPYCYPLTIADAYSRLLLSCTGLSSTRGAMAQPVFRRVFQTYGLPRVIRTDNGVPFASPLALGRLSALAVWWIRLGIRPERIAPGKPQQNGQHERMHRTLKAEATRPACASWRAQQARFERFRAEYNHERPHEALELCTPTSCYVPSPRPYPPRLPELDYPAYIDVRLVHHNGTIKWRSRLLFLSGVLAGEQVGIEETEPGASLIRFGPLVLGTLNETTYEFTPGLYWKLTEGGDPTGLNLTHPPGPTSPILPV